MICDLEKYQLKFIINNHDYGIAFDEIEKTKYRAVINLHDVNDSIMLLQN